MASSQEKQWFSSESGAIVGTVIQDLQDKDYFYILMHRKKDGSLEGDELSNFNKDRLEIRRRLLDEMQLTMANGPKT